MEARQSQSPMAGRRLERINAIRNAEYTATPRGGGFEINLGRSSFRIRGGSVEEIALLYSSLGLEGPDDFAIPASVWAAALQSHSELSFHGDSRVVDASEVENSVNYVELDVSIPNSAPELEKGDDEFHQSQAEAPKSTLDFEEVTYPVQEVHREEEIASSVQPLIVREVPKVESIEQQEVVSVSVLPLPPGRLKTVTPPPVIQLAPLERGDSTWEIVKSFAPDENEAIIPPQPDQEEDQEEQETERGEKRLREGVTETGGAEPSVLKRTIGSWNKGHLLGSGAFGAVYEAINHDGFFFAIKEIFIDQGINAKQAMIPLEQEVSLLSRLQHENIVQYYGTEQKEGKLYIFLELVTQGSLASLYRKYQLQDSQVSAYTRQILYGLNYLHQRNVLHRDIKCANILVDSSGCVKLADFGLAKEIDILIQAKSCKGSVYWMAPEVAKSRPYGPSADIWSLGCTVLEMLTGKLPYPDTEWMPALFKIGRGERPPIPATLSEDARDFIDKCLQVNAGNRPSAVDLLKHPFLKRSLPDDHSA